MCRSVVRVAFVTFRRSKLSHVPVSISTPDALPVIHEAVISAARPKLVPVVLFIAIIICGFPNPNPPENLIAWLPGLHADNRPCSHGEILYLRGRE